MTVKVQLRRGTASGWTSANPTLSAGEIGIETDTGKFKIGNGSTSWTSLSYGAAAPSDLNAYVATATKAQANGVASLDASALVPIAQIPSTIARSADVLALAGGTLTGALTLHADPSSALHAATKQYVDAATAGLNVHDSATAATTANIDLSTALENGDTLDGITLTTGDRVLVKNQTSKPENGIYVVQSSGSAVRADDYNTVGEVDAGDFIFVESGTINGKTGWVQVNTITTLGTDNIEFTQFSGAGTYTAGTGLSLAGGVFSIDTSTTTDLTSNQTLTNKTLTAPKFADGGFLADANGNEILVLDSNANAVNEIAISNAAASNNPSISVTGSDTDISLNVVTKGSGVFSTSGSAVVSGSNLNLNGSTPAIKSSSTTAASIFPENVTGITIGSSSIKTTAFPASGTTSTATSGAGYMGMPQNSKSSSYTLTAEDSGKHIYVTSTGQTLTIPANSALALPIGTTIVVVNGSGVSTTIAINSDTLRLANSSSTGSRTLASNGFATLLKINTTEWIASGNGLS